MNQFILNVVTGIILIICILGCASSQMQETQGEMVVVDITNAKEQPIESLVEDIKFVPLETQDNILIQDIQKLTIVDDNVYVLDRHSQQISIFSIKSGKFINKINKIGSGPGEYLRVGDFQIDKEETIEVLDNVQYKFLKYSKDGDYLSERKLPFAVTSFCYSGSEILLSKPLAPSGDPELMYQLVRINSDLKVLDKYLKIPKYNDLIFSSRSPFQDNKLNPNFLPVYDPHIYELSESGIRKKYFLDFGKNWPEEKVLYAKYAQPFDFIEALQKSGAVYFLNYVEGEDHLILFYEQKGEGRLVIYNKASRESTVIKEFNASIYSSKEYLHYHEGYFVSIKQPMDIYNLYNQNKLPENIETTKLMSSLNELDNPIIMFTKFKN